MSLQNDLDDLMFVESIPFDRRMRPNDWMELFEWCDQTFGKGKWHIEKGVARFRKPGSSTLFLLRWG